MTKINCKLVGYENITSSKTGKHYTIYYLIANNEVSECRGFRCFKVFEEFGKHHLDLNKSYDCIYHRGECYLF